METKLKDLKLAVEMAHEDWMWHIANGIGNTSNQNTLNVLEDFATCIKMLSNILDMGKGTYLDYYTSQSKHYRTRVEQFETKKRTKDENIA